MGPGVLAGVLGGLDVPADGNVLVGLSTGDDAGVYRLGEGCALVQTVDFISPVADDPYRFGQIAAANSLSDVWAMGGRPLTAMNVLLYPSCDLEPSDVAAILAGGADKLREAGCSLVGGHTVEAPELFYGLSVTGLVDPQRVVKNAGAHPGDLLILTKPLGLGLLSTAVKAGLAAKEDEEEMVRVMSKLNNGAAKAMEEGRVSAATDVTGFGLAGHALGIAKESGVDLVIDRAALPILAGAKSALALGLIPAGAYANREAYRSRITVEGEGADETLLLLCDPQTSGGLLLACAPDDAPRLLDQLKENGCLRSGLIGRAVEGRGKLRVG